MKRTIIRCDAFNSFLKNYKNDIESINYRVYALRYIPSAYIIDIKMNGNVFPKPLRLVIDRIDEHTFNSIRIIVEGRVLLGGTYSPTYPLTNLEEILKYIFWTNSNNVIDQVNNSDLKEFLENNINEFNLKHSEIIESNDQRTLIHFKLTSSFIIAINNSKVWKVGYYHPNTRQVRRKMKINKDSNSLVRIVSL